MRKFYWELFIYIMGLILGLSAGTGIVLSIMGDVKRKKKILILEPVKTEIVGSDTTYIYDLRNI